MHRIRDLALLTEKIRALEKKHDGISLSSSGRDVIPTGWEEIDAVLHGGVPCGLHEWFGLDAQTSTEWAPPLCLLSHVAWQAFQHNKLSPWIAWIGKSCHPYPRVLLRNHGNDVRLMRHSLYASAPNAATRLWAAEVALRSPVVGCVIADGNGLNTAATRRLQLLAREQEKWILLARPPAQKSLLSAAQTRWQVRVVSSSKKSMRIQPRWNVELLRCKGLPPIAKSSSWLLEWNRNEGTVHLSSQLADVACQTTEQIVRQYAG